MKGGLKNMDEEKKEEKPQEEPKAPAPDTDVGVPSEEEEAIVKDAKEAADAAKTENDRKLEFLEREEKLMERKEALAALGGGSSAGSRPEKPKPLTDTEYAEALERGEVNPLKEDGLI
jgi:hypothetical protein